MALEKMCGSQQNQSQSVYSADELSAALQSEACLDRLSADAITEQVAFQSLPREQVQEIVEAQLCEVSNYKIIPITTRERGLVQSGCRYQDIDAAIATLSRRLNPDYVEQEPEPVQVLQIAQPLLAVHSSESFPLEVNHAGLDGSFSTLQLLLQNRVALMQLAQEVENSGLSAQTIQDFRYLLSSYSEILNNVNRALSFRAFPEAMRSTLSNNLWASALTARVEEMLASLRFGTVLTEQRVGGLIGTLQGTIKILQIVESSFSRLSNPAPILRALQPLEAQLVEQGRTALEAARAAAAEARRLSLEAHLIPPGAFSTTVQIVRPAAQAVVAAARTQTPAVVAALEEAAISTAGVPLVSGGFRVGAIAAGVVIAAGGAAAAWYYWWNDE